jgi:hypothetical protein
MDITEKIKSYEDACEALELNPENLPVVENLLKKDKKSIIAYYKLTIIIRALNEGWEPNWSDWNEKKYFNWFFSADGSAAGFADAYSNDAPMSASTNIGSRLCFKTRKLATYARLSFASLYYEYLF